MENKINLEEFMLKQLDWSIGMKSTVETKAAAYLTVDTLILNIIINFIIEIYKSDSCKLFKWVCIFYFLIVILFGLILLVLCAKILYPKQVGYFSFKELLDIYHLKEDYNGDFDSAIIQKLKEFMTVNEISVNKQDKLNLFASKGLLALVISFINSCFLFLIFIGVVQ